MASQIAAARSWRRRMCAVASNVTGVGALLAAGGCMLIYPEVSTPVRPVPKGSELVPEPPRDLIYVKFAEVSIPERTRDGRRWDAVGGSLPDPFARLVVNEKVLVETPVEQDTLVATWPDQIAANYTIPPKAKLRVEVWDKNALTNEPICVQPFGGIHAEAEYGELRLRCDSGALVTLTVERARARWGLGMSYEIGGGVARLTKTYQFAPVTRGGLAVGDEIVSIDGVPVESMDPEQVASAINAKARTGVKLKVQTSMGRIRELTLKEGPIYPTFEELKTESELGRKTGL